MTQAKIILTRIDNRLVHGQVGVTWTSSIGVDTIVVIDDDVAQNGIRQKLMVGVAHAANVQIRFYSVDDFVRVYKTTASNQRLFLVVENPQIVRKIIEKGVILKDVNIGNMHYEKGKVCVNRKVYVNEEDIASLNYLLDEKVNLFYQDVPGMVSEKIDYLDFEILRKRR